MRMVVGLDLALEGAEGVQWRNAKGVRRRCGSERWERDSPGLRTIEDAL